MRFREFQSGLIFGQTRYYLPISALEYMRGVGFWSDPLKFWIYFQTCSKRGSIRKVAGDLSGFGNVIPKTDGGSKIVLDSWWNKCTPEAPWDKSGRKWPWSSMPAVYGIFRILMILTIRNIRKLPLLCMFQDKRSSWVIFMENHDDLPPCGVPFPAQLDAMVLEWPLHLRTRDRDCLVDALLLFTVLQWNWNIGERVDHLRWKFQNCLYCVPFLKF